MLSLFKKWKTPKTPIDTLKEQASTGDRMRTFLKGGAYQIIDEEILQPMELKAFETFKKVDPSDELAVIESQMISKVINQIKTEIDIKIQTGDLARQELLLMDSTPETEE